MRSGLLVSTIISALVACGGESVPDAEGSPSDATSHAIPIVEAKVPDSTPSQSAPPEEENVPPDSPTYVTGPLGFIVRDARAFVGSRYVHDMCGQPSDDRHVIGILLTSFVGACDRANAKNGDGVLRIDFTAESGSIPAPGSYALPGEPGDLHEPAACGKVWRAMKDACADGVIMRGPRILGGQLELSRSDEDGMEGVFEIMVERAGVQGLVTGRFVAPRCASDYADACTLR